MIGNPKKNRVGHLFLYQSLLYMHLTKHKHWKHQKERKEKSLSENEGKKTTQKSNGKAIDLVQCLSLK